jgi:hypothetical protein
MKASYVFVSRRLHKVLKLLPCMFLLPLLLADTSTVIKNEGQNDDEDSLHPVYSSKGWEIEYKKLPAGYALFFKLKEGVSTVFLTTERKPKLTIGLSDNFLAVEVPREARNSDLHIFRIDVSEHENPIQIQYRSPQNLQLNVKWSLESWKLDPCSAIIVRTHNEGKIIKFTVPLE